MIKEIDDLTKAIALGGAAVEVLNKSQMALFEGGSPDAHHKAYTRTSASGKVSQIAQKGAMAQEASKKAEAAHGKAKWGDKASEAEAAQAHREAGHAHLDALKDATGKDVDTHHLAASHHLSVAHNIDHAYQADASAKKANVATDDANKIGNMAYESSHDGDKPKAANTGEKINKMTAMHLLAMEAHQRASAAHSAILFTKNHQHLHDSARIHAEHHQDEARKHGSEVVRIAGIATGARDQAFNASKRAEKSNNSEDHKEAAAAHRHAASLNSDTEVADEHMKAAGEHDGLAAKAAHAAELAAKKAKEPKPLPEHHMDASDHADRISYDLATNGMSKHTHAEAASAHTHAMNLHHAAAKIYKEGSSAHTYHMRKNQHHFETALEHERENNKEIASVGEDHHGIGKVMSHHGSKSDAKEAMGRLQEQGFKDHEIGMYGQNKNFKIVKYHQPDGQDQNDWERDVTDHLGELSGADNSDAQSMMDVHDMKHKGDLRKQYEAGMSYKDAAAHVLKHNNPKKGDGTEPDGRMPRDKASRHLYNVATKHDADLHRKATEWSDADNSYHPYTDIQRGIPADEIKGTEKAHHTMDEVFGKGKEGKPYHSFTPEFHKKNDGKPFVLKHNNGNKYLVDPSGYDYARYISKIKE